jgi:colanic acid/amylovoran biosynthesis glycosyltransferase
MEAVAFAIHQLGLQGSVRLMGALSRDAVRDEMNWADVFLHASVSEGFSNAVLEAQAMRLPVVCTDAGGLPENVLDSETGFVVRRREVTPIVEKLALLARSPQLRMKLGRAGRRRVENSFNIEEQLSSFEAMYLEVHAAGKSESGDARETLMMKEARRASE